MSRGGMLGNMPGTPLDRAKQVAGVIHPALERNLLQSLGMAAALALVMSAAIGWRIAERPGAPSLLPILAWQVAVWLPWIVYYPLIRRLAGLVVPVAPLGGALMHGFAASAVAASHLAWYWQVSTVASPLAGLPDTKFGVYAFFFVFWFLIDLLLYAALLSGFHGSRGQGEPSPAAGPPAPQPSAPERRFREHYEVKNGRRNHVVPVEKIRWIEAQGYYAALHTESGAHLVRRSLAKLEQDLDPQRFVRIHRSTIVSLANVAALETDRNGAVTVCLADGGKRRASRAGARALQARLRPRD